VSARFERVGGAALAVLLIAHVTLRPEHGWVLLWGCDASAAAIAIGLLLGAYRLFAAGALFQLAIGAPAFLVGLATTYVPNVTGVGVHTLPPVIGGLVIARRGLPARTGLAAAVGYAGLVCVSYVVGPVSQNINFSRAVFAPMARAFHDLRSFWIFHLTAATIVLLLAQALLRRLVRGISSVPRPAPLPPPDTA
jgi:hypothetical protein